jgi:hypothetical protein
VTDYVRHYNTARPHRGIDLNLPAAAAEPTPARIEQIRRVERVNTTKNPQIRLGNRRKGPPEPCAQVRILSGALAAGVRVVNRTYDVELTSPAQL